MSDDAETKSYAITRAFYALTTFAIRNAVKLGITVCLIASVAVALNAVGRMSRNAIKQRKEVLDLIYWRDPKKSAAVLALSLLTLVVFARYPLISVLSYLGLAVLGGTLGFRLYKTAEAQVKKTDVANPFKPYLEEKIHVPQDRAHQQLDVILEHGQDVATQLRRLFLVEDIVESAKFGLLLWALTYVGCWFSGVCLLSLVVLGIFSIPKVYEVYQEPIDKNLEIAKKHIDEITKVINEKLPPFLKKAQQGPAHEKSN